jgi:integrase/recombinase XerC
MTITGRVCRGRLRGCWLIWFRVWILRKGKLQKQPIDLAARIAAAVQEWLAVREGQANEPIFIALDGRSHGKRLSGRSAALDAK